MSELNAISFQVEIEADREITVALAEGILVELNRLPNYEVQPQRNGTILDIIVQMAQHAWDSRDLLMALFKLATPALNYLITEQHKKGDLKVTLEIDGKTVVIEASDAESLAQAAEKFLKIYPEEVKKVSTRSKMKVKASRK